MRTNLYLTVAGFFAMAGLVYCADKTNTLTPANPRSPRIVKVPQHGLFAAKKNGATNIMPAPGIYTAVPYSCLVAVPYSVDPKMIVQPRLSGEMMDKCLIQPPLQLIPRK